MKKIITLLLLFAANAAFASQGSQWWSTVSSSEAATAGEQLIKTKECRFLQLDLTALKSFLETAPMEFTDAVKTNKADLELPMPDGSFQVFRIVESPVCAPALAAKFPETRTWSGQGLDDVTATVRLDVTPWGFHAMILSANGDVFIDPYNMQTTSLYISYFTSNCYRQSSNQVCRLDQDDEWNKKQNAELRMVAENNHEEERSIADNLRTYALALACTGEYAAFYGGTVAGAHGGMVTSINRVTGVYEKELDIRLQLIPNNDTLIFLLAASDPYDNFNGSTMLGQNQTTVTTRIGAANYDIGHVFSTGGGGIAGLGVVCQSSQKARGVTGLDSIPGPINDPFDIDFVAHEMGHQFGGNHTFNSVTLNCGGGNRNAGTAYEPGSGITIMAYAGICGTDDLALHSIANFHTISFDEIENYTTLASGNVCPTITPTGNNAPVSSLTIYHYDIPVGTPFYLTGSGSDPDMDTITYSWEEFDLGPAGAWNAQTGNAPLFKSYVPSTNPVRLFPKLTDIVNNQNSKGELEATYARTLNFRMTLRDNRNLGGGVTYDDSPVEVNVVNSTVPFKVTYPNTTGITWAAGSTQTITWDVAATTAAPVNTPTVAIYLSTAGGLAYPFPYTIATNVPNTGSYTFTVPNHATTQGRIMVAAEGNIFFDINDKNFTITGSTDVNEALSLESVNLVPNPAGNEIQLIMSGPVRGKIDVSVFDVSGRMVMTSSTDKNAAGLVQKLDITSLESGIYTISINSDSGMMTRKFSKM
jgi:hypothetical protein